MSRLQHFVEQRRAVDGHIPNPFYGKKDHALTLRIEDSAGILWLMPWSQFASGRHEQGARDQLALTFVAHEIVMRGTKLGELFNEAAMLRLEWVRAIPTKYLKAVPDGPAIESIEVRPLRELITPE